MKIWINACEVSGDLQAGILLNILKESNPNICAIGMGGEKLQEAGQENFFHVRELSVMGGTEILSALPRIIKLLHNIKKKILEEKPDAILLVDSAEFNFRLVKFAKKHGIKVYYFIPPKVWAWRTYRVKFLKKYVDKIFCILPFEEKFYKIHGIDVEYIQNPLVDFLAPYKEKTREITPMRISIMPGSRKKEVSALLPTFAQTALLLKNEFPQLELGIIQAPNMAEDFLLEFWNCVENAPNITIIPSTERYPYMRSSEFCIAASGTATLETGLLGVPTIVAYKVSKLTYFLGKIIIKGKYIGLVNLILDENVFPEYIQDDASPEILARQIKEWVYKQEKIEKINYNLRELEKATFKSNNDLKFFIE